MPSHSMEERSRMILRLLQERERITVPELTRLFAASEVTIRQDLAQLEAQGKLTRIRGGAIRRSAPQRVGFDMRPPGSSATGTPSPWTPARPRTTSPWSCSRARIWSW
jgi:hypothetical protein